MIKPLNERDWLYTVCRFPNLGKAVKAVALVIGTNSGRYAGSILIFDIVNFSGCTPKEAFASLRTLERRGLITYAISAGHVRYVLHFQEVPE